MEFDKETFAEIYSYLKNNESFDKMFVTLYPYTEYNFGSEGDTEDKEINKFLIEDIFYREEKLFAKGIRYNEHKSIPPLTGKEEEIQLNFSHIGELVSELSREIHDQVISPDANFYEISSDLWMFYNNFISSSEDREEYKF